MAISKIDYVNENLISKINYINKNSCAKYLGVSSGLSGENWNFHQVLTNNNQIYYFMLDKDTEHLWYSEYNGASLYKVDYNSNTPVASFTVGNYAQLTQDSSNVYVTNWDSQNVSKIVKANNSMSAFIAHTSRQQSPFTLDSLLDVFIGHTWYGRFDWVNKNGTPSGSISTNGPQYTVYFVYDGQYVWGEAYYDTIALYKIDPSTHTVVSSYTYETGSNLNAHVLGYAGGYIWMMSPYDHKLYRVNPVDGVRTLVAYYQNGNIYSISFDPIALRYVWSLGDGKIRFLKVPELIYSEFNYNISGYTFAYNNKILWRSSDLKTLYVGIKL